MNKITSSDKSCNVRQNIYKEKFKKEYRKEKKNTKFKFIPIDIFVYAVVLAAISIIHRNPGLHPQTQIVHYKFPDDKRTTLVLKNWQSFEVGKLSDLLAGLSTKAMSRPKSEQTKQNIGQNSCLEQQWEMGVT